jgi:hypothetical protein
MLQLIPTTTLVSYTDDPARHQANKIKTNRNKLKELHLVFLFTILFFIPCDSSTPAPLKPAAPLEHSTSLQSAASLEQCLPTTNKCIQIATTLKTMADMCTIQHVQIDGIQTFLWCSRILDEGDAPLKETLCGCRE